MRPTGMQFLLLGEVNTNLTGLYDMLVHMSEELEAMRQRQLATEKELNATREVLRIGILQKRFLSQYMSNISSRNVDFYRPQQ